MHTGGKGRESKDKETAERANSLRQEWGRERSRREGDRHNTGSQIQLREQRRPSRQEQTSVGGRETGAQEAEPPQLRLGNLAPVLPSPLPGSLPRCVCLLSLPVSLGCSNSVSQDLGVQSHSSRLLSPGPSHEYLQHHLLHLVPLWGTE